MKPVQHRPATPQQRVAAPPHAAAPAPTSPAERAFTALDRHQRDQLLRSVFSVLEYDEHGNPGVEWSSDTTQAIGELFAARGVVFTSPDDETDRGEGPGA